MIVFLLFLLVCEARIHVLRVEDDTRFYISLTTFGLIQNGTIRINVTKFQIDSEVNQTQYGFGIARSRIMAVSLRTNQFILPCKLGHISSLHQSNLALVYLTFDRFRRRINFVCNDFSKGFFVKFFTNNQMEFEDANFCNKSFPINIEFNENINSTQLNFQLDIEVFNEVDEGIYAFFYYNCLNMQYPKIPNNLSVLLNETNGHRYLTAGEIPLPTFYFLFSLLFLLSSFLWMFLLIYSNKSCVYHTHWVMFILGCMKSASLMFHGINYLLIQRHGYHIQTWALLFYITHLVKGGLLFTTILLLGTGWTFIKHVLSNREKKLFMFIIPMQLLANVVQIILEESEEGDKVHATWREVLYLLDIICCAAVLFPVIWSIRHLQEASKTDGKVVLNLKKLELFRHFYVIIVAYIYVTRIVVYLLEIMLPFRYEWFDQLFRETVTFIFYAFTAYKFRPDQTNPYFQIPQFEDEYEVKIINGSPTQNQVVRNRNEPSDIQNSFVNDKCLLIN